MKKLINIFVVAVLIAAVVLVLKHNKKTNKEKTNQVNTVSIAVPVKAEVIEETVLNTKFNANGYLEPISRLSYLSEVGGRIIEINVDKGDKVKQGTVLARIDNELLTADLKANETAFKALKIDYERFKKSNDEGGVSQQQLDNLHTQLVAAESRYSVSKRRYKDAQIQAPASGTINNRFIEIGSFINPGTRLFDIVDDSKLKMQCTVSEKQVLQIQKGQNVSITCTALPGEIYTGKIDFIGAIADRGLNYSVEIILDQKGLLRAGMFANATFEKDGEDKGILISRNAILGSVKSASVFVIKNNLAYKTEIITGETYNNKVEIISGLAAGDSVVVAGIVNLSNGVLVNPKK